WHWVMPIDRFKSTKRKKLLRESADVEWLEDRLTRQRKIHEKYPRLNAPKWREAYKWLEELKRRKAQSSTDRPPIDAKTCHGGPTAEYQEKSRTSHTTGKTNTQGQGISTGSENERLTNDEDTRSLAP